MDIQNCVNSVLPSESCLGKKSLKRGEMSRNAPAIRADAASGVPVHGVRGKDWFFDPLTLHLTCHFAPFGLWGWVHELTPVVTSAHSKPFGKKSKRSRCPHLGWIYFEDITKGKDFSLIV